MYRKVVALALLASQANAQITLDAEGFAGEYSTVVIGQDNLPIIAYQGDGGLRVIHCESTDCNSGTIYEHGGSATEISMAIRSDGRPLIAYRSLSPLALRVFDCDDAVCSSGTARSIDTGSGRYSSMVVRDDGRPMIASHRSTNPRGLRIFDCADGECSTGTIRTLDSTTDAVGLGTFTDIAISDGLPIISYVHGFPVNQLKVFRCSDVDCIAGDIYALGSGGNSHSEIVVPADGRPLITYYSGSELRLLDCADSDCATAEQRTLDRNSVGAYNSLAINADGLAVVSYRDDANRSLKTFACDDSRCLSGAADTVDAVGDVGQYTGIALRPGEGPIITYYDPDNTALKAYGCPDQGCAITVFTDSFE